MSSQDFSFINKKRQNAEVKDLGFVSVVQCTAPVEGFAQKPCCPVKSFAHGVETSQSVFLAPGLWCWISLGTVPGSNIQGCCTL
jgi:hypothetical protein